MFCFCMICHWIVIFYLSLNLVFVQLYDFCRIHPLISKIAVTLVNSFIHFCLDYCYGLFYDLPNYSIRRLQKVQNTLLALSLVVFFHHTSFRFLNLCIGYPLTIVLILRFVASLIVLCLYMYLIL